jgi:predicted deacylase
VRKDSGVLVEFPAFLTVDGAEVQIRAHVFEGNRAGATVYIGAATHGNELQGLEICRRLAEELACKGLGRTYPETPDGTATFGTIEAG